MSKIVTFEQAKRLGKHGFNESVNSGYIGYTKDGELVSRYQYSQDKEYQTIPCWIKAPTVCHALDWVREEFNLMCGVYPTMRPSTTIDNPKWASYKWSIMEYKRDAETGLNKVEYIERNEWFDTHPLASSALLDAVLTYLEQKEQKIV